MIYLSTGGFPNNTFLETTELFNDGIVKGFELSAGKYTSTLNEDLFSVKRNFF